MRAIDDLLAVVRPEWTTVVAEFVRQPAHVLAVGVHRVDVEIAVAHRSEDELLAVERDRRFGVVAGRVGQLLQIRAVRLGSENIERSDRLPKRSPARSQALADTVCRRDALTNRGCVLRPGRSTNRWSGPRRSKSSSRSSRRRSSCRSDRSRGRRASIERSAVCRRTEK